ncbi:unnamed protein product [Penicillium nalgiovense]|uniref:Uncharacterized protein n=1 Tax=Penicillium nalgiovense TaxID=60175 RepID=A0A9W4I4L4_PENNA|nr:unnamed protein product [Penicillium nalgiovense]CAG8171162.1 unnamed protein product [Penicillium nalgiovense]CAG8179811.1 unnamed protein product [Penicillium nalgiovense]CAG8183587.1 unnamed protein product [Penicillium nalgiovense]CAG8186677.1 unnamed protein product [Penicillium nalgiovense]
MISTTVPVSRRTFVMAFLRRSHAKSNHGRCQIWRLDPHLLRFHIPIDPKHASDCPSPFPPSGGHHLGPFVMSHRGGQEPALNPPRLGFLDRQRHCVLSIFVVH